MLPKGVPAPYIYIETENFSNELLLLYKSAQINGKSDNNVDILFVGMDESIDIHDLVNQWMHEERRAREGVRRCISKDNNNIIINNRFWAWSNSLCSSIDVRYDIIIIK